MDLPGKGDLVSKRRVKSQSSQLSASSNARACVPNQDQGPLGVDRPAHPQARALDPPPELPEPGPSLAPGPVLFPREATFGELCFCALCQRKPGPGPELPQSPQPREAGSAPPPGGRRRLAPRGSARRGAVEGKTPPRRSDSRKSAELLENLERVTSDDTTAAGGSSNTPPQETTPPASSRNPWDLDDAGGLAWRCHGCGALSDRLPDAPGNARTGQAWARARAQGWRELWHRPRGVELLQVWCPACVRPATSQGAP